MGDKNSTIDRFIKKIIFFKSNESGEMPPLPWIIENTQNKYPTIKEHEIKESLNRLIDEKFLVLKDNGWVKINPHKKYKVVQKNKQENQMEKPIQNKEPEENLQETIIKQTPVINTIHISDLWLNVLRYVLLIVGGVASYMSIYYSYKWVNTFLGPVKAFMLSSVMVIFAISAFELIIFFHRKKVLSGVLVFSFLWLIVTLFSITSTVAGQYNARIKILSERYTKQAGIDEYLDSMEKYKSNKERLKKEIEAENKNLDRIILLLGHYDTIEKINSDKNNYERLKKEQKSVLDELKKINENYSKNKKPEQSGKTPPDFYLWAGGLFTIRPDSIEFWLSIFPAIFIDIIAPLSFAIVMFFKDIKTHSKYFECFRFDFIKHKE